jgi:hypothetical protein
MSEGEKRLRRCSLLLLSSSLLPSHSGQLPAPSSRPSFSSLSLLRLCVQPLPRQVFSGQAADREAGEQPHALQSVSRLSQSPEATQRKVVTLSHPLRTLSPPEAPPSGPRVEALPSLLPEVSLALPPALRPDLSLCLFFLRAKERIVASYLHDCRLMFKRNEHAQKS